MMKIGIVLRNLNNSYEVINNEIISYLNQKNCILVGIVVNQNFNNIKKLVDECSGIILPGGKYEMENDKKVIEYLYQINKPTLGICLGAEEMAEYFYGKLVKISNNKHNIKRNYVHKIYIINNTILKKILNRNSIIVNSRHDYEIKQTKLLVSAYSNDGKIEAIESIHKKFFIGVCYHPESLKDDINSENLINYFLNVCYKL